MTLLQLKRTRQELIDTLWNVNAQPVKTTAGAASELIDTLWNVNQIKYTALFIQPRELIDTLWNVNVTTYVKENGFLGINRYIMECKYL